jgi:hypothetical protein
MSFTLTTEDNVEIKVDNNIAKISKLFETLLHNYKIKQEQSIQNLKSNDIKKLIDFCEKCNYTPIRFDKPLWSIEIEKHKEKLNNNILEFYNNLDSNKIYEYSLISDFYEVDSIDELIYLKLYEVFQNDDSIKNYFEKENNDIKNNLVIDDNRKKYLYDKYKFYIQKQLNELSDDDINNFCNKFF